MGRFTKVSKAEPTGSGRYFLEGNHDVEIEEIKAFESQNGEGLVVVVEAKCLGSTNKAMEIGGTYAMVLKLEKHKSAPANLAAFMVELVPLMADGEVYPEDAAEREVILEAVTDEKTQPARGTHMRVEAWNVKTKAGADFTKLRWCEPKAASAA